MIRGGTIIPTIEIKMNHNGGEIRKHSRKS